MSYNGHTNFETWTVAINIDNDQGMYQASREMIQEMLDEQSLKIDIDAAPRELVDEIYGNDLGISKLRVDWTQLVNSIIAELVGDES